MDTVVTRSSLLTAEYSLKLTELVNATLPEMLDNAEYAARTSALMVALNRELARLAATCGESQEIDPDTMMELVSKQFVNNFGRCLTVIRGEGHA